MILISGLPACKPDIKQNAASNRYFNLKAFFHQDSLRISKQYPLITKTAAHNGNSQTKKVHIDNWGSEFSLFTESDINKPAWRESYTISTKHDSLIYRAKSPDLRTRQIIIVKKGEKVRAIIINNSAKNLLYQSTEKLSYYPDSLYLIEKNQEVRFSGGNNYYLIKGNF